MKVSQITIGDISPDETFKLPSKKKTRSTTPRSKEVTGNGHWEFPEEMGSKGYFGFIYAIFDPDTQRGYIGKKQFYGTGKLNKGDVSNWRRYTSSSKELQEAIRQRGIQNFRFICLEQYKIRGTLGYAETWTQCLVETPTTDKWYNGQIEKVSWKVKEAITDRHKERLQMVIEMVGT